MSIKYQDREGRYILPLSKWEVLYDLEYKLYSIHKDFNSWAETNLREYPPEWSLTSKAKTKRISERKTQLQKSIGMLE